MLQTVYDMKASYIWITSLKLSLNSELNPFHQCSCCHRKPILVYDEIFQIIRALSPRFADFNTSMLAKPPLSPFKQFILAPQNHKQTFFVQKEEEKKIMDHIQTFARRGSCRNEKEDRHGGEGRGSQQNNEPKML